MGDTNNARVVKCYRQGIPKLRFVGKCYHSDDCVNGIFGHLWGVWFENGYFKPLEKLVTDEFRAAYEDADAYVAMMKCKEGAPEEYFEYWIGMFLPEGCEVPDGYEYIDISYPAAGVCWFKGVEMELYCHEDMCFKKFAEEGMSFAMEADGEFYSYERYVCPRFTEPDENKEVVLDIGIFME